MANFSVNMTERAGHLDTFRFAPSEESLRMMQGLKRALPGVQKKFPEVKGFGFFGSRVLGTDRPESDLDTIVFFNSNDAPPDPKPHPMSLLKRPRSDRLKELGEAMKEKLASWNLENSTVVAVDISPEMTQAYLTAFIEAIDNNELSENPSADRPHLATAFAAFLLSRFHIAAGDEVYSNRKFVLDYLERQPKGERYFKALMNHLAYTERVRHPQDGRPRLPKTIAEARKYFFVKE